MISVQTVPIEKVKDGPYRNTFSLFTFSGGRGAFKNFENLVANLINRAKAGHSLAVHVAPFADFYLVLDGHVCVDVYRYIGAETVAVIVHEEITTAIAALEAYVAFNYLRADWRDSTTLMPVLGNIANLNGLDSALALMNDPESAKDLIRLRTARWWEFGSPEEASMPVLDDMPEELSNNEKKVRGDSHMASLVIHGGEAHRRPPRGLRKGKKNQEIGETDG